MIVKTNRVQIDNRYAAKVIRKYKKFLDNR